MIKIIFFLSLIYLISCESDCERIYKTESPAKAKDCTSTKSNENKLCCYYEFKCPNPALTER